MPIEGVLTDSMIWRSGLKNRVPAGSGSPLAGRAQEPDPCGGQRRLEGGAVVVLVADQDLPRPAGDQGGLDGAIHSAYCSCWYATGGCGISSPPAGVNISEPERPAR